MLKLCVSALFQYSMYMQWLCWSVLVCPSAMLVLCVSVLCSLLVYGFLRRLCRLIASLARMKWLILLGSKGHGYQGVVTRWRATRLPRKTHRGLDKVACIGAWHPAHVSFIVARAGQRDYYHRVGMKKKVYKIGKVGENTHKAATKYEPIDKGITPYQYSFVLVLIHCSTLSNTLFEYYRLVVFFVSTPPLL